MIWIIIAVIVWLGCGVLSAGLLFAHAQSRWPEIADETRKSDYVMVVVAILFGLIGLFATLIVYRPFYGWRLK